MAAEKSISDSFNHHSGVLNFIFETIMIGIIVGGIIDFTFFHNHPAGKAIIEAVNEPLLGFYDGLVSFFGFSEYARAQEFLPDLASGAETCFNTALGMSMPC
ncbi:MAG: hypothetical protein IT559_08755 [Alphaproteobacteria bacterium]|nr:hypothetical protein [Alphaproteobacteria bacterium]